MAQLSEFPDWTDEAGNPIAFTEEEVLRRLAPLARHCPAAHARLTAAFHNGDLMGFIKTYRRLSEKRRAETSMAFAIAVELLPVPPGTIKFRVVRTCPVLTAEERRLYLGPDVR